MLFLLACVSDEPEADRPYRPHVLEDTLYGPDTGTAAPEAGVADDAVIVSATFPDTLACDEAGQAVIVVRNTGTATWNDVDYKLGGVDDADDLADTRVYMAPGTVVPPGGEYSFTVAMVGPAEVGTYHTDWQMVHEAVQWFGETAASRVGVHCEPSAPTGQWVCAEGARNGDEVCDDAGFYATTARTALKCESATGGVAYIATNTGPACSDGVNRCQGWEESGQEAWDHLDYVAQLDCETDGQYLEVDLRRYDGEVLYVGSHTQPDGSGRMTWGCIASWVED